jgi:dCTP diphosphatase
MIIYSALQIWYCAKDLIMNEIIQLTNKIRQFRDERDWAQFHNHKDMALSLVLEATEVLEHFQWKSPEEVVDYGKTSKNEISEELADVAIYLFELADNLGIDLSEAIENKLKRNTQKYPVEKAKGKHTKYTKL